MPLFSYQSVNENGKKTAGVIHAESLGQARSLLLQKKIYTISLRILPGNSKERFFKKKEVLSFTQQTAKLLAAGLPLYEAILSLEEKYRSSHLQPFLLDLAEQLRAGHSFSDALKKHPKNFDFLYCAMVANAEKTGSLEQTLEEIAHLLERGEKMRSQLISTLIYPAFLLSFSLMVVFALLFFILPSLFELFEGRSLHPLTKGILFLSRTAIAHKFAIGASFVCVLSSMGLCFFSQKMRSGLERFFLQLPFVKSLMLKVGFIRYFRSLSTLLQGGVPLLDALKLSRSSMHHPLLDRQMKEAEKRVGEGWLLSVHLEKSSLVPKWVCRMVAVAERTGDLQNMLRHIADIY